MVAASGAATAYLASTPLAAILSMLFIITFFDLAKLDAQCSSLM